MSLWDRPAVRFIVLFFGLALALNLIIALPWVKDFAIRPYTVFITWISGTIIDLIPGYEVFQRGTILRTPEFAVDIRRGCDGVVATIVLISACLAYPAPWRQRLLGTLGGYVLIFFLNLIRIVVLFVLGQHGAMNAFEFVHTYVAQFAVIALTMVFWIYWAGRQKPLYQ